MKNNLIVKSLVLFLVTAMLANVVWAAAVPRTSPKGAIVTGYVELTGTSDTPNELQDIFKGPDETHVGTKMIFVKGTYKAGAEFVSVEEDTVVGSSTAKYWFNLPIPSKVSTYLFGNFSTKDTVAVLAYTSQDAIQGTGIATGSHNLEKLFKKKIIGGKKKTFAKEFKKQLKHFAVKNFRSGQTASIVDVGQLMSVNKVTAKKSVRPRGKATVTGALTSPDSTAKGRFSLNMGFDK